MIRVVLREPAAGEPAFIQKKLVFVWKNLAFMPPKPRWTLRPGETAVGYLVDVCARAHGLGGPLAWPVAPGTALGRRGHAGADPQTPQITKFVLVHIFTVSRPLFSDLTTRETNQAFPAPC